MGQPAQLSRGLLERRRARLRRETRDLPDQGLQLLVGIHWQCRAGSEVRVGETP